ncbi:MAG: hypothetical protein RLZZ337_1586, partial [Bacteroidota bacterium]
MQILLQSVGDGTTVIDSLATQPQESMDVLGLIFKGG